MGYLSLSESQYLAMSEAQFLAMGEIAAPSSGGGPSPIMLDLMSGGALGLLGF